MRPEQTASPLGEWKVLVLFCAQRWEMAARTQLVMGFLSQPSLLTPAPPLPSLLCPPHLLDCPGRTILPSQDSLWKCIYRDWSVFQWEVSPFQTLILAFPSHPESSLPCPSGHSLILLNPAQLALLPERLPCHPRPPKRQLHSEMQNCPALHSLYCQPTVSWTEGMCVLPIH